MIEYTREQRGDAMKQFAVLQLSGCAGCEVTLLNADAWMDRYRLVYMPLVILAHDVPQVEMLMVSGAVHTDMDIEQALCIAAERYVTPDQVKMELEQAVGRVVRGFDPCIACATH
jgi:uncharacterized membrane protein (UPF0182 family)